MVIWKTIIVNNYLRYPCHTVIFIISTHWGRVTHICVSNLTIIGSDNGLSPGRRQAIIWTNVGILLIGPWGTNFSEILIGIQTFSLKKMHLKMSSAKWRPFCFGLNELKQSLNNTCDLLLKTCVPALNVTRDFRFERGQHFSNIVSSIRMCIWGSHNVRLSAYPKAID